MLRRLLLLTLVLLALLLGGWTWDKALATTGDPRFDAVSSLVAGHETEVLCYAAGEDGDPDAFGAWGYVWSNNTRNINLGVEPCEGLYAIADHDATVPLWKQALGALVLAHEAYHQNFKFWDRLNEAKTECRAIRGFTGTVRVLGGSAELADSLQSFAFAIHFHLAAAIPQYNLKGCRTPWYWH